MICIRCLSDKSESEFYAHDRSCKECRRRLVRENRVARFEQYAAYEKRRFKENPERRAIAKKYAQTERGKESIRSARTRWVQKNPEKRAAHLLLAAAIKRNLVIKPHICSECGEPGRLEAHHSDYSKPLEVEWLCRSCHAKRHFP